MKKIRVSIIILLTGLLFLLPSCFSSDSKATIYIANYSGDTMWYMEIDGTEYFQRLDNNYWIKIEVPTGPNKLVQWYSNYDSGSDTATRYDINMDVDPGVWTAHMKSNGAFTVYEGDYYGFESGSSEYGRNSLPPVEYKALSR